MNGAILSTPCPCCDEELYRSVTEQDGVPQLILGETTFGPNYAYAKCAHCGQRINLDQVPVPAGAPQQFEISPTQDCKKAR